MKVLWLSWKDKYHPLAGGAEVVTDQILSRLANDRHEVTLFTANYDRAPSDPRLSYKIIRSGGRLSVYWCAYKAVKRGEFNNFDLLVEEVNTIPFFSKRYKLPTKRVLFFHQLAREVWFYQMLFPLNVLGYLLEPLYLRYISKSQTITVSNSTKNDLVKHGFMPEYISIVSEGITLTPISDLDSVEKFEQPTLLSLGAVRPMKRTLDQVKAFEIACDTLPSLKLVVAGALDGSYGDRVTNYIKSSRHSSSISLLGRVSPEKKQELMQRSHLITVTSIKEGWGLIVTEANSQGTPAVVYDVDGLRDSVRNKQTGLVVSNNTPASLAEGVLSLLKDEKLYNTMRVDAWQWSKKITFDQCYLDFLKAIA